MTLTALVTGATSTLGEAFARSLAAREIRLILTGRHEGKLSELSTSIPGVDSFVPCDLAVDPSPVLEHTRHTSIDILVNNAGVSRVAHFHHMPTTDIDEQIQLNILALTRLCRHYLHPMIERGHGRILNVASIAAFHPFPNLSVYAASKAYVLSLSESLAEECNRSGVGVTCLCPGNMTTEGQSPDTHLSVPDFLKLDPVVVADTGIESLMSGETICIPDKVHAAAVAATQHQPRWLMRRLASIATRLTRST